MDTAKQLYDALKTVQPDFEWESDDEWEAWQIQRAAALKKYEEENPLTPLTKA